MLLSPNKPEDSTSGFFIPTRFIPQVLVPCLEESSNFPDSIHVPNGYAFIQLGAHNLVHPAFFLGLPGSRTKGLPLGHRKPDRSPPAGVRALGFRPYRTPPRGTKRRPSGLCRWTNHRGLPGRLLKTLLPLGRELGCLNQKRQLCPGLLSPRLRWGFFGY
jgi:hypothetical protein